MNILYVHDIWMVGEKDYDQAYSKESCSSQKEKLTDSFDLFTSYSYSNYHFNFHQFDNWTITIQTLWRRIWFLSQNKD